MRLIACWILLMLASVSPARAAVGNNLDVLIQNDKLKFVFVGGKGGVGKTTSSSAIAAQLSLSSTSTNKSRRVLLISTDPAHSLSDAFRMNFSNVPTPILPDLPNLEVMEVNPAETMKAELAGWVDLAQELGYDPESKEDDGAGGIGEKIHSFQEWLSGVPGIDEATALSSAIEHIESGRYDLIVFDTAPTGHTLKLLELPKILQVGLDKLESWQATLWGYWEMIKGLAGGGQADPGLKERVAGKLRDYKASIGRVSTMITDKVKTRFVVVCIAEYLSISESRRLLSELDRFEVLASHVVVNQLVMDYLDTQEMKELERQVKMMKYTIAAVADGRGEDGGLVLEKALAAAKLTSARHAIQSKYLNEIKQSPEVKRIPDPFDPHKTNRIAGADPLTVLEVPLLPNEVTGPKAILEFSHLLVGQDLSAQHASTIGIKGQREIKDQGTAKRDSVAATTGKPMRKESGGSAGLDEKLKKGASDMISKLMEDPELKSMIDSNPKLVQIVDEVKANPMAGLQYMMDPEVSPFIQKAMAKLGIGGGGGLPGLGAPRGGKGGRRRKKNAGSGDVDLGAMMGALGGLEL